MDILRPPVVWVNGMCYRKEVSSLAQKYTEGSRSYGDAADEYEPDVLADGALDDEEPDDVIVEQQDNGRFRLSVGVASAYFGYIIGKKGATKKRIEVETGSRVAIPKAGCDGDIVIVGDSRRGVVSAWNRIKLIVESARKRQEFTHFISLPMNAPQMQEAFLAFKRDVLDKCQGARGLDASIFQKPELLHLTIGTMALMDAQEREKAMSLLQDCKEQVLLPLFGEKPIDVSVSSLEIMNDDPGEADVIYAKVVTSDDSNRLQLLADQLVEKFVSAGIMFKQYDRVKLHLTLINSLFRKDDAGIAENETGARTERGQPARETIDAKPILAAFSSYKFCDVAVDEIHLSQRRAGRRTESNYYFPTCCINISSCG